MSKRVIALTVAVAVVGIGIGVIIGYFSHPSNSNKESPNENTDSYFRDLDTGLITQFVNDVQSNNIKENLKYFAEKPHMATSPRDVELATYIRDTWKEQLDDAYLNPYEVMHGFLSEDKNKPNRVTVVDPNSGETYFEARKSEIVYPEYMNNSETIVPYYSAYGPPGNVRGKLVYANYGSEQNFLELEKIGVELNGTIALIRYGGGVGRGEKARNAEKHGVKGVLVYSDPENYAVEGEVGYPKDSSLPGTGVQRGSTLPVFGDPTTPNFPSTEYAYRIPVEEMEGLPPVPLQPIGYDDAAMLLNQLGGQKAPETWTTGLDIDQFHVGPGFTSPNESREVRIEANNVYSITTSYNVMGLIWGSEEPDKYVMYGNHRDAWVYGAVDPSSGTSCMMETTRIYGNMVKNGWKPRRTILFSSWGSEEFGLIGSTEWAEDNLSLLSQKAVSYINVDIAVFANMSFFARASPMMKQVLYDAADIPDEIDSSKTLKEIWIENYPNEAGTDPYVGELYSSSDYAYFYQIMGISAADLSYRGNSKKDPRYNISPYPTYHSAYDTFDYVERFVDPGFLAHQAVTRVAGSALLRLADSLILPFSINHMNDFIQSQVTATQTNFGAELQQQGLTLDHLKSAATLLKEEVVVFQTFIEKMDRKNLVQVISVNDRLMMFDRMFIEPSGLPGQPFYRHVSGSPGLWDGSSGSFPGIQDAMYLARSDPTNENWKIVEQQIALVTYKVNVAVKLLKIDF